MLPANFRVSPAAGVSLLASSGSQLALALLLCFLIFAGAPASLAQQEPAAAPAAAEAFSTAGIGTGSRTIDGLWQFHLGDDPDGKLGWAQPGFDDSKWERMPADGGDAGRPGYTGFAWCRRKIALDPADKNPLALYLPPYPVEEVYWNGIKVGGIGTPPPHPVSYFNQPAVAILLPTAPDADAGTVAIRLWSWRGAELSGIMAAPRLGYAPLIQRMAESWVEYRLRVQAVRYALDLIYLCVGLTALILWLRSRSQWILLCAGAYFVSSSIYGVLAWASLSLSDTAAILLRTSFDWVNHTAFLFLILLLAALPNRPGIRGFRFWKRVCLVASALVQLGTMLDGWTTFLPPEPHSALFRFLDELSNLDGFVEPASLVLILIACLVLSKPRLPRLLFMAAAALAVFLGDLSALFPYNFSWNWMSQFLYQPLFHIYGSHVTCEDLSGLLLLLAVIYAVWDQLSRELAEQRRANAELKAAQEVQTILVAAEERGAPGYAVASVYRPASEVGGDFFQVIPLDGDGTLIVAGDVSGKGLRAAMAVSLIVGAVRTLVEQDSSPAAVLAGLNRRLIGRTQGGFATCCAVRIDPTGHAIMANAGHCQPYLDGREVELPAGLPLGLVDGMTYDEVAVAIGQEQQLTLVSDGVVEARNHHGELYGFDRLSQLMQDRPTAEYVANTAIDFGQDDDITVLTVTRLATA